MKESGIISGSFEFGGKDNMRKREFQRAAVFAIIPVIVEYTKEEGKRLFRIMYLQMAQRRRAWREDLPKIWKVQMKYVYTGSPCFFCITKQVIVSNPTFRSVDDPLFDICLSVPVNFPD